jgi:hypothetical protein
MAEVVNNYLYRTGVYVEQLGYRCVIINAGKVQSKQKSDIVAAILKTLGDSDAVGGFIYKNSKLSASFLIKED